MHNTDTSKRLKKRGSVVIEPLESRLLFSATTDIALLDDGASELDFIVHEALTTDLSSALDLDDLQLDNTLDTVDIDLHESYVFGEQTDSEDVTQLVFVDTSIEGYQALVDDIIRENSGDSIQVITIDTEIDGIEQITQYLEDYSGLNSVHIVSHGSLGQVELGSTTLSDATIDLYDSDLQSWGNALSEHADILFYGCNIASSENGLALIGAIAQLTRADVAASDDLTGDDSNNGDWVLESSAGEVTTATLFNTNSTLTWSGLLATPSATADTTNVWIGETITGNVIDGTGGTGITADTLGDGTTQIASVTYDSVLYDTWVDDQLTITADSGTFVIERDGTFTYTATADGLTASPYSQPTWMETYTLYGFEQNVSHESGGNLSLSGYNNSYLYQSSSGLGMISHPYSDGIDFTWTGTSSEVVVVDLGAEYTNAQIALSNLDAGEIAYWEVYGDDFVSVANSSVTNVDSFTISEGAGFRYIAFTADEWDGVAATWTDYRVFEISAYQSTPGDDVFTYTIEDDSLNTSSNTLTVSYVNDNVNGRIAYSATSTAEGGTATAGAITDSDVAGTPTYQWIRSTDGNTGWENIEGATSSSYTMTSEDVNQYVRVEATYTDGEGTVEQIATYVLGPITNTSSDSGSITDITGTETELETLTAGTVSDSDTISSAISYQWQRSETGTGNWTDISGATSSTYQLEDADSSQYIRVTATYTDSTGDSEWVASNATGQITDINQSPVLGADDAVNIDENTTTVGNYAATDPDASDSVSYSLSGNDSALFTIDTSGNLAFASARDFETYTDNDSNGVYEVTITATDDGTGNLTDTQNVSVTIDDVNENPVLGADAAVNVDENTTAVGNYAATDVDAGQTISYTLSGDDSGLFTIDTSGNLAFSSVRDFETYTDNNSNGVYEVTITATDDGTGNLTDTQNVSVTIDDVNENPVLGADDAVNIDENTTAVGNYAATDVDSGQTISYSLSGADSALFTIDASGNLAFSFGRDFETYTDNDSNGVYEVTITATDNGTGNLTDTQNVSVTIDDVNENPVLGADAAVNVDENTTAVGNYAATDEDAGQTISYSLSGADAALFTIDASGNLAFASSRDFETYTDNDSNGVYEVTITATDDGTGSLTDTQNVSVTIDDVNENPVLGADAAVNIDENTTTVGNYAATDVDAGQTISYSLSGADSALFTIDASGNLAFATSRDFETYTDNDSNGVYEVTITATDDGTGNLTDTQNVSVTIDDVNENPVLGADDAVNIDENTTTVGNYAATDEDAGQSISYSLSGADAALFTIDASGNLAFSSSRDFETYTDNDSNGVYEVTITATDNGSGNLADTQNVSITIDDVNENPVLGADAAVNIDENTTAIGNYAATDVDAGQTISYTLSGDDSGLFTIDASGNLAFATSRDFETYTDNDLNGVYEVTITATDDGTGNLTDTQNISVTIDDVNENPVLGADDAVNIDENTTAVGNYAATDVDAGQTISYSLSGDDTGLFTIDASGNLAFSSSRDFETYTDNDSNGVYEVTITATDNGTGNLTDTQNVSVTIADVNENPVLGADVAVNINENSTAVGNYTATDVDAGQSISYSLSGDDSALFTIDASGNLAFATSRDFETYTDNDSNGVYEVTITASDNGTGNLTDTQNVSVTIDDVNENPVLGADAAINIEENTTTVGNYAATAEDSGQTISYSLSGDDSALFTIDTSGNLSFISGRDFETYTDGDSNGIYEVTVTATDDGAPNLSDMQNVSITITDNTNEFSISSLTDVSSSIDSVSEGAINGTFVGIQAYASDNDGSDTVTYSLLDNAAGRFGIDSVTGNVFVLDNTLLDFEQNSSHQINVQASSSDGSFSSQYFTINIENANELGVLTIPNNAEEDQLITASVTDQDGLSNTVNFTWQRSADGSTWFDITGATSSSYLLGDDDAGQYVRVTAQYVDDGGFTESIAASLLTPVANVNDAANVSVAGIASQNQILTASVSDQDGITNPINFQWQASIDGLQWSNITNANSSQLQLTNAEVGAFIRVAVDYTDDQGTLETVTSNATEAVLNVNDAPTLATPLPDYNLNEDVPFVISIGAETFVDIDGDPLSLTATLADGSPLPVWLQFNSLTNELSGTANASQKDDYEIRITASDSQNLTAEDQFILVISAVNDTPIALYAPTVNNIEDGNADIVDLRSVFSDEEDSPDTLSYNILNNSNENLFSSVLIDATTGELIINYAPDANGTASLQVSATDSQGASVQTLVNVTVAAVNDSPVALGTEAIAADLGVQAFSQYNLADLFEDLEDGNRLTYTIVGNSNPDILNDVEISGDNALLIIRYSPSLIGNAELVIRATDSEGAYVDSTVAVHVIDSTSIKTDMDTSGDSIAPPNYEETLVPSQTEDSTNTNPEVETPTNSTNVTELQNNPATPEENTQELDGSQRLQGREAFLSTTNTLNSSPNHSEMNDLLQAVIEKQREKQRLHENKIKLSQISPDAETPLISLIELDAENENDIFEFKKSFLHVKEDISEDDQTEQASKLISTGLTVSITTGLMVWSLRASSFLFTLFSMTPLWKGFDPLPIVTNERVLSERKKQRKDKKKEDRDSNEVGYMFDHTETGNQ